MTKFLLHNAHPAFREQIVETYTKLQERYPFRVEQVELYEPRGHDMSMGAAYPDGTIKLNAYWFAGTPDRLNDSAKRDTRIVADDQELEWHGPMVKEPEHVLVHEFGHIIEFGLGSNVKQWSKPRWLLGTIMPATAPTGYALTNDSEYFAEAFAMYELGYAEQQAAEDMQKLLSNV